ncbi:MAG: hypothetical protein FJX77_10200, partial [Armatimonadetes bacterium]|nr:hypothetical protein [Armatimonadota bacterium]
MHVLQQREDSGAAADQTGFRQTGERVWPMEAGEREYFLQEQRRHPLTLIRSRSRPEFQAEAGPRGRLDDREVETLTLTLAGAMTHLL